MPESADDRAFRPPKELLAAWTRHPDIVKLGDPVLRKVAEPVRRSSAELQQRIDKMIEVMNEAYGLGLAAPQVGVSERLLVYKMPDENAQVKVLINPQIVTRRGEQLEPQEGCLSIPGLQGTVARALDIRVKAFDRRMKPISLKVSELEARVIQHEIDHLDGILFIDRADPATLEWVINTPEDESEEEPNLRE